MQTLEMPIEEYIAPIKLETHDLFGNRVALLQPHSGDHFSFSLLQNVHYPSTRSHPYPYSAISPLLSLAPPDS